MNSVLLSVIKIGCYVLFMVCAESLKTIEENEVCDSIMMSDVKSRKKLEACSVIEGNLKITLFDFEHQTFPKLIEITGYMLLYRVEGLRSLSNVFPNLTVIRGQELMFNYALVVYEMQDLEEIGLYNLRAIMRGAVRVEKNNKLCYVNTVDWSRLTGISNYENNKFSGNKHQVECVNVCPSNCAKITNNEKLQRCWNSEHCQTSLNCPCRYCVTGTEICCHEFCVAGCTGPGVDDCLACKHVEYNNKCQRHCPPNTYMWKSRRCLMEEDCTSRNVSSMIKKNDRNYLTLEMKGPNNTNRNMCVPDCPSGYTVKNKSRCVICQGRCPKECPGGLVDSIHAAETFRGCTLINGQIKIQIDGSSNTSLELEASLGAVEEVMYYIKISRSYPLLSLHFFKNLKKIHGNNHGNTSYSLEVIDNPNLEELFLPHIAENLDIGKGKVKFHYNRKLCYHKIKKFLNHVKLHNVTTDDVDPSTNGDLVPCDSKELSLKVYQVMSTDVLLQWEKFKLPDNRMLYNYAIYYREVESKNVDIFQGRDACSQSDWKTFKGEVDKDKAPKHMIGLMHNLTPWTLYAAYVKPSTSDLAKESAISNIVFFKTLPSNPSMPTNLMVFAEIEHELRVRWDPPTKPNGKVTHYKIYWKLETMNVEEYDKRNYCLKPIFDKEEKEPEKNDVQEEKKNKTFPKDGCCVCPKSDNQIDKNERSRENQIAFENLLRDLVYVKTTSHSKLEPSLVDLENISLPVPLSIPTFSQKTSFLKRKLDINTSGNRSMPEVDTMLNNKHLLTGENNRDKFNDTLDDSTYDNIPSQAIVNDTSIIITNLGHFEKYNIRVLACLNTLDTGEHFCSDVSNTAIADMRTKKSTTTDTIDPTQIKAVVYVTGKVNITWKSPPKPNGLIVTFEIEYKKTSQNVVIPTRLCLSHKKYRQSNGYILEHLTHGNYSFRIRATSLAGNGTWTPDNNYFVIEAPQDSNILQRTAITVIAIGVIVGMIIIAIIVWFVAKSKFLHEQEMTTVSMNPGYMQASDVYIPDEWEIDRDKVQLVKKLGEGSFGMVWEGLAQDIIQTEKGRVSTRVAIKIVNEHSSLYDKMNFLKEASIMKSFKCYHVVQLLGVVSKGQPTLVIMELMQGDLKRYLLERRPDSESDNVNQPPGLKEILQMLGEIADGMAYLADKKFVHRDLAARNCMVSETNTVKIGDFGMTRDIYQSDYYRKGGRGRLPVRWMAPESLKDGLFSTMSDVWSYGVVLWEMATLAAQPYQGLSHEEVLKYVSDGKLMEKPEGCPDQLYNLMLQCWRYKERHRPTFKEIIEMLVPDLNPGFMFVSYFFCDEYNDMEKKKTDGDNIDTDLFHEDDFDNSLEYDSRNETTIPFIEHQEKPTKYSSGVMRVSTSEPCDCIMLVENGKVRYECRADGDGSGVGTAGAAGAASANCAIGNSESSKEGSKSSDGSYTQRNGLVNGHIHRLPHASSC